MDHLTEAKERVGRTWATEDVEWAQLNAQLGILHVLIAIAERLPPPAETWSERHVRLQKEEHDGV